MEQDIPEKCGPCLRQDASLSLDFGVPMQEPSMSLNLGAAYLVSSSILEFRKSSQQKFTVTIGWIALQVLTYVQGKHKP